MKRDLMALKSVKNIFRRKILLLLRDCNHVNGRILKAEVSD